MRRTLTEPTIIFIGILIWTVIATCVGAIVGLSTAVFLEALAWSSQFARQFSLYFLFLPVGLFLSVVLVKYLAPDAEGHGTEKVIEAVHKYSGKIKPPVVPVKLAATIITLASGGSVGKEGPCAQIGAGLASIFADIFRFSDSNRRRLVICGISAGFASVFGTPIAGAIFGVEVLFMGSILYDVLLPSFISGIMAYEVSSSLGIRYFYHSIDLVPVFSESFFIKVLLSGVFFGLCSLLLIESLKYGEVVSNRIKVWKPLKGIIGGIALVVLTLILSQRYLGLGIEGIEASLNGQQPDWYAFAAKIVFTSVTLSFGGSGGIVTPIFFIGATSGSVYGTLLGMDAATFAAVGMVAVLAGSANTPIAASIMAVELFGPRIAPYATVACIISFLMTGHRSVYPSQILSVKKSTALQVELGKEVEGARPVFQPEKGSFIAAGIEFARSVRSMFAKEEEENR